jgi:hypothetical protein
MSKDDILSYLGTLRKPDSSDPLHKWIGTYYSKKCSKRRGKGCLQSD